MKTKIFILFLFLLMCWSIYFFEFTFDFTAVKNNGVVQYDSFTGVEIPKQGEFNVNVKWEKYNYDNECSVYPFWNALPSFDKIPEILNYLKNNNKDSCKKLPYSQLVCLTRISFDKYKNHNPNFDEHKVWQNWWETVGEDYFKRFELEGTRNPEAWKLLVGDEKIPCPNYKILIPKEWNFDIHFRTGDYQAVQREVILMERTKNGATLKRHYSVNSTSLFQYEIWHGFTPQEADQFLYALAYAIDQPWFVENFIIKPYLNAHVNSVRYLDKQPGRKWNDYVSEANWSGVLLPNGRIWWNDDPETWANANIYLHCQVVYPFLCHNYPEKKSVNGSSGWEPDPNPPPLKDQPKSLWPKPTFGDHEK